ncbi:hypothetical protein BS636_06845 [Acinetobacter sp. LoGeW2-3]|uniref:tetratricopeptide repeat protein n=1 Tax=Acinetobacter sp. LoGeW2-3 TaxID=1808001 RepID=UPI000C05AC0D|nr:SEL1-like repeat protein [Acinetobacter sp. LoGeW2-3]ATO19396.1 hypothetical protein BS636_06845 [Acinetobacter sp. LoGeW2-3]
MLKKIIHFLFSRNESTSLETEDSISEADTYYLEALQFESLCHTLKQHQVEHFQIAQLEQQETYQRNAFWNYLSAALRGHAEAQYILGKYYLKGSLGLDRNYHRAEEWLGKAKQQGHKKAAQLLSNAYSQISV